MEDCDSKSKITPGEAFEKMIVMEAVKEMVGQSKILDSFGYSQESDVIALIGISIASNVAEDIGIFQHEKGILMNEKTNEFVKKVIQLMKEMGLDKLAKDSVEEDKKIKNEIR